MATSWIFLQSCTCIGLLWLVSCPASAADAAQADSTTALKVSQSGTGLGSSEDLDLINPMIDWFVTNGGIFSSKLEMRREFPDDPYSRFGMFTTEAIENDELLLHIPRKVLLDAGDDEEDYGGLSCPTVYNLIAEMKKGDESFFAPYVNYLASQSKGQLPSHWSAAGKAVLYEVLAVDDDDKSNDLPPSDVADWITHEWYKDCDGSRNRDDEHAALLVVQRSWDELLIPIYDMISHRNGKWLNTKSNSVHKNKDIDVTALRDIKAGEEIYMSYNFCIDCGKRASTYGTAEILREYGFVENYPQRWFFGKHGERKISFELDEGVDGLEVNWLEKKPWKKAKRFMVKSLNRLLDLEIITVNDTIANGDIPSAELSTIRSYHKALINALAHALDDLGVPHNVDPGCSDNEHACAVSLRYDDLSWEPDEIDYTVDNCDSEVIMSLDAYEPIENVNSFYQKIDFWKDPSDDNVCFQIHRILQICGSYRPHYHEMVVHYTARFLPDIRRVLWVGGGDSMLLHEIMKYPNLEFVVGLELDQVITRLSYKHLGSQPLFDDPKVQWWYGDAAKSLLMLPEDYFGSFDMVLVDLSETVMSKAVTDGFDILQALSLLLKPEGIFVKNENHYLEKMAQMFDYALEIHYSGVPMICSQCLIFGSNKVDFLNGDLHDHRLTASNLYIPAQADIDDRYQYYHDYTFNNTSMRLCLKEGETKEEPVEQTRSPGVLMIVEIEDTRVKLDDPAEVLGRMVLALERIGRKIITTSTFTTDVGAFLTLILHDGYVIARTWLDQNYAAVDIHMWSRFNSIDTIRDALVAVLGSSSAPSSYRIVAGGMFGVDSWKSDATQRGPHVNATCSNKVSVALEESVDKAVALILLKEAWRLFSDEETVVAVLCGEEKDTCPSVDVLKALGVEKVVPLFSCPDIDNEFAEGVVDRMDSCGKSMYNTLLNSVSREKKFGAFIIDDSASRSIARVAYKILKARKVVLFEKSLFVMAVIFEEGSVWRRHLLERFRKNVAYYDPNFRVEVLFNTSDASMELSISRSGDEGFLEKFKDMLSGIETKTGMTSVLRAVVGGQYPYEPDWKPSHYFLPGDYDQRSPLEQWQSQTPMGYQTVFQFEVIIDGADLSFIHIKAALIDALASLGNTAHVKEAKGAGDAHLTDLGSGVVGDGALIVATWSGGNSVLLWDGRFHVDLNLFTFDESPMFANAFADAFLGGFEKKVFQTALQDIQPRGYGRVVSLKSDIADIGITPHWAKITNEQ